jgi:hypothetical protein
VVRSFFLALAVIIAIALFACVQALDIDGPITIKPPGAADSGKSRYLLDDGGCLIPEGKICGTSPQCGCGVGDAGVVQNCIQSIDPNETSNECIDPGKKGTNAACTKDADCIVGHACLGFCAPFCDVVGDCPDTTSWTCDALSQQDPVRICLQKCDVLKPFLRCDTNNCTMIPTPTSEWSTLCFPAGTDPDTDECQKADECPQGKVCSSGRCHPWCRIGENDCKGGAECIPFEIRHVYEGKEYGVCALD